MPDDEALDDIALRWAQFGDWRGEVKMEVAVSGCLVARRQRVEICRHATMARVYVGWEEEQHKSRESGEWLRDEATPRLAQVDISPSSNLSYGCACHRLGVAEYRAL